MADRQAYLNNEDDQISAQKRIESTKNAVLGTAATIGIIAGAVVARRKIKLSEAFSDSIRSLGRAGSDYDRYLLSEAASSGDKLSSFITKTRRVGEALIKPIPSGLEEHRIALDLASAAGLNRDAVRIGISGIDDKLKNRTLKDLLLHGPTSFIQPMARIVAPAENTLAKASRHMYSSGRHGAIYAQGTLYRLGKEGQVISELRGVKSGVWGSMGSRIERQRMHANWFGSWKNQEDFFRRSVLPSYEQMKTEHQAHFLSSAISGMGRGVEPLKGSATKKDLKKLMDLYDSVDSELRGRSFASDFLKGKEADISRSIRESMEELVKKHSGSNWVGALYKSHKVGSLIGAGPQFASGSGHGAAWVRQMFRDALEMGLKDEKTGRRYAFKLRYGPQEKSLGSKAEHTISIPGISKRGSPGQFYVYSRGGELTRNVLSAVEGTFFKSAEDMLGIGISFKRNRMTDFVANIVGYSRGSWQDYAFQRYGFGTAKLMALGYGGYTAFQFANYLTRSVSGGWGISDVAGKMYTSGRELQQQTIDALGVTNAAREAERLFPGTVKSPLAGLLRLSAPVWGGIIGGKVRGRSGALVGVAMGLALSMLTFGDPTQSQEELHKIYTGEQDVPVRRGRWWMFGKTGFFGGKAMYYRPHWYPLMRSRYQYKGQLFDSEAEELSTRSPLAPILSPILGQGLWDPYRWEKKHYKDRPYPMTGELFEPTTPFGWLGNLTIGNIIKPQRLMHVSELGGGQDTHEPRSHIYGASGRLGYAQRDRLNMFPSEDPSSLGWQMGMAAYTMTEQMGIRGFAGQTAYDKLTGRSEFLPKGPVMQTASRAYGFERDYWDRNIGDPFGTTEFFRRILPHRRRDIDEFNPIRNEMPGWLPGSDYYIDFRSGDPYTKVEMGEARLPGAGYESLHRLHSGVPGTYDAVDRFMILADIAPHSKEYYHYKYLAEAMTRKEPDWAERVNRKEMQRQKMQEEYEFLDLNPPEDAGPVAKIASSFYRRTIAAIGPGGLGGFVDPFLGPAMGGFPLPFVESPISKWFPYRTATQTYKDFRLHGSDFASWADPYGGYIRPYLNKIAGTMNPGFVPKEETERREMEEYFDRLSYLKYKGLEKKAIRLGEGRLSGSFMRLAGKTMTGVDPYGETSDVMSAIPKRERAFFKAFTEETGFMERAEIPSLVSKQMAKIYSAQWGMRDSGNRGRAMTSDEILQENKAFFSNHYMPSKNWEGWNPDVDIKDVQLKTVRNEGMDIHKFDLWESQERSMSRAGSIPLIEDIGTRSDMSDAELVRMLQGHITAQGYDGASINITRTPSRTDTVNLKLNIRKKRDEQMKREYSAAMGVV